ncbi:sodium-dependent bicarbonate transport family permease, partial [Psychromonas sp.]|uniref:sodium-dependent bicarbonate transport family permease n=1 Tax=Psychromonas sp. TaxID=1884585 RepID=UPI003566BBE1
NLYSIFGFIVTLNRLPDSLLHRFIKTTGCTSIAAHYGSVSVGTYAVAVAFLEAKNIADEAYIPLFVVLLEMSAIELAPRGHNSGHWTQVGSVTCQFENHVRALAGLTLGSVKQLASVAMINLIGTEKPPFESLSACSKLYWYNKSVKPQRKLGHVNFVAENSVTLVQQMDSFKQAITGNEAVKS